MHKHLLAALSVLCLAFSLNAQTTSGLTAYFPMNGNFTDASGNGIGVTNTGATATSNNAGAANSAMYFGNVMGVTPATVFAATAITGLLNFPTNASSSFTIAHSFRITAMPTTPGTGAGFFDNNFNYWGYGTWFWRSPSAAGNPIQLLFNCNNTSYQTNTASVTISLNTWYHFAAVKSGSVVKLYVNGNEVAITTTVGTGGTPSYTYAPKFGTLWYDGAGYFNYGPFNGSLDEFRAYNRALTAAEVATLASVALPVKLTQFTATKTDTDVKLNWQTQYEQNSSHFNVQRSTDGINFTTIATVQAKGNTNLVSDYQYTDNTIQQLNSSKVWYYRLQQVDKDNRSEMSSIVSVKNKRSDVFASILQNPANNELRLQLSLKQAQKAELVITNAEGKVITTKQITVNGGDTFTSLPVNNLSSGTYYVTVIAGEQKQTLPFVKTL